MPVVQVEFEGTSAGSKASFEQSKEEEEKAGTSKCTSRTRPQGLEEEVIAPCEV